MFFLKTLEAPLLLHPRNFTQNLTVSLHTRLLSTLEGTCDGLNGYIVAIVHIGEAGAGKILDGLGFAEYRVKYTAVVMKPFKGECMDAVITTVNKV